MKVILNFIINPHLVTLGLLLFYRLLARHFLEYGFLCGLGPSKVAVILSPFVTVARHPEAVSQEALY